MEWVETTGRSIEEAKDAALDELGVDEVDAEFEILEEPRPGLFGRVRGEARVRARVRPATPRPKVERRDRRRRADAKGRGESKGRNGGGRRAASTSTDADDAPGDGAESAPAAVATEPAPPPAATDHRASTDAPAAPAADRPGGPTMTTTDLEPEAQAPIVADFLDGLVTAFGLDGEVSTELVEDAVEAKVAGDDLGLLIGPKGTTLNAVQELARTVVQRKATTPARVRVDVGGYRERRREALARFTEQVAAQVLESGSQKALEPMSPADRKVVHDTANEIDGVATLSEGEEPRRRVVIIPAD